MTELLDMIDGVVADWEAQPEAWNPGDPLHTPGDVVRPMFQVITEWAQPPRCEPCQVIWSGDATCWVCGEERPAYPGIHGGAAGAWAGAWAGLRAAGEDMNRTLAEITRRMSRELDERMEVLLAQSWPAAAVARSAPGHARPAISWSPAESETTVRLIQPSDITAPTLEDLTSGIELSEFVVGVDLADLRREPPPSDDEDTRTVTTFWGDVVLARPRYPRPTEETR